MTEDEPEEDPICSYEGWLMVCEGDPFSMQSTHTGYGAWHPGYCVARNDEKSLICYRWEPKDVMYRACQLRIRIDNGSTAFSNYWNVKTRKGPKVREMSGFHSIGRCTLRTLREEEALKTDRLPGRFATVRGRRNTTLDDVCETLDRRGWSAVRSLAGSTNNLTKQTAQQHAGSAHNLNTAQLLGGSIQSDFGAQDDGSSTPQKLANFFSRPFRTNPLKRTKSVNKLEKQQQLTLNRVDAQRSQENLLSVTYANRSYSNPAKEHPSLKSSRSHESLLNFSTTSHMIDLGEDVRLHPIHSSVLPVPNCFRVANTYYACRTPLERAKWIENLRRTMNPRQDLQRRLEHGLQLWILEAKGIPAKRRYFCEICLDKVLHARTTAKPRVDNVFWGEHFEFPMLPKYDELCVNVYREGDPKKKKDRSTLIGYVLIGIDQLTSRHPVERWYTVTTTTESGSRIASALGGKNGSIEQAAIRIKARWQSVEILPLRAYDDLLHFLTYNYLPLCSQLEPILSVKAKEDFATTLVRVLHRQKLAKDFLCDLIMSEINLLDNDHLMFRGNSLATKAMEAYMKLIADDYLQDTLGDLIRELLSSEEICEVDPLKLSGVSSTVLEKNRNMLTRWVEKAWSRILVSTNGLPVELREVFCSLRDRLDCQGRGGLADTLISSSIFLRYLCPAILSPSLFNLCSEYPSAVSARNLTLIAKTLQNLANFTKFGGKEHYMEFMNNFVEREWQRMKDFLFRISTGPCGRPPTEVRVDVGRELSLLTTYLEECWSAEVHERASSDRRLVDLRGILGDLREHKRRSATNVGGASPMVHQTSSDYENSPQQGVLRTRNENLPAYRSTPPTGQATVVARNRPAAHLLTNDDYVSSAALTVTPTRHSGRISDDIGTASSRGSQKTSSSGEARDTDSDPDIRSERTRARKAKRRLEGSDSGSQPPSSGYHSNNHSSYSNSSSSSPIDRLAAISITNPAFETSTVLPDIQPGPSGYNTGYGSQTSGYSSPPYRANSPPAYDPDMRYGYQSMYATPPDCDISPRSSNGKSNLPRTNPRASRSSALLRPTVIDVMPEDWEKNSSSSREASWNTPSYDKIGSEQEKIIEEQRREIERLIRENAELKRHMVDVSKITTKEKRSLSGQSEDSYDSLSSLDRPRKTLAPC